MIEDPGGMGLDNLQAAVDNVTAKGNQTPGLAGLFTMFRANTPQLYVDIDREKCKSMGVALSDVFNALQVNLGGLYVNDFNEFGRTWQVVAQADKEFRTTPDDVGRIYVRNQRGDMVPLAAAATVEDRSGPVLINRYNGYVAAAINGGWAPGVSSGQAVQKMETLADADLPSGMTYDWTELMYQQIMAGNTALFIFPLCVLFVFLTHSAEYESWALPLAIILIVPMSLLCAPGGHVRPGNGQQHLHTDRVRGAGRPGV